MQGTTQQLEEFTARLQELSLDAIRGLAVEMRHHTDTAAGEVAWWHATVAIERSLRASRMTRLAAVAAHNASRAVLVAAERGALRLPDAEVTVVARAAAQVARAIVAGERDVTGELLRDFAPFLSTAA